MTNKEILATAIQQSAIDCTCAPDDFFGSKNKIFISKNTNDARKYLELPFIMNFVSYGDNIVCSTREDYLTIADEYLSRYGNYVEDCFETPHMHWLSDKIDSKGARICFMAEYWLPDINLLNTYKNNITQTNFQFDIRILTQQDFSSLYTPEWSNALCEKRKSLDVLGIGVYLNNEKLIALAACSADCDSMWQIGIDVLPEYRRLGIASFLVNSLAKEIISRGKVPFYCCAWSNVKSARTAIKAGFRPAWVEMTVKSVEFVNKMNARD